MEKREDVKNSVLPRWRSAAINRAIFNYCKKGHIYIIIMQLSSINLKLCILVYMLKICFLNSGADPAFWMTGLLGPHNNLGGPEACSPGKFLKFGPLKQRFLRSGVTF